MIPSQHSETLTNYYAIVLAAGRSTRMGKCKTELPWLNGTPLLSYQLEQLVLANIQPLVVLGPHNCDRQQQSLASQFVINPIPGRGKVSSILVGLEHLPKTFTGLLIAAVDQPRSAWVYQTLVQNHRVFDRPITLPTCRGQRGHPLLFSSGVLPLLQTLNEETLGIRRIVKLLHPHIQFVEFDTSTVLTDLNTPEQYRKGLLLALDEANRITPNTTHCTANPQRYQRLIRSRHFPINSFPYPHESGLIHPRKK